MEQNLGNTPSALNLNDRSVRFLSSIARWGKFMAIVGYVVTAIMLLGGILAGATLAGAFGNEQLLGFGGLFVVTYTLAALLFILPLLYLNRFSAKMKHAIESSDEGLIAESLKNLKFLFTFLGILTIAILAFYVGTIFLKIIGPMIHNMK
jgi:magnesium-transporting ATPase (P-type)